MFRIFRRFIDDRGQTTLLSVVIIGVIVITMILLVGVGNRAADLARAQTAADAAALAAAAAPDPVSAMQLGEDIAVANGARSATIGRVEDGDRVQVTVNLDFPAFQGTGLQRSAAAQSQIDATGLAPAMRSAVARAEQLLGRQLTIVSGRRSLAEQQALWDNRANNRYPVAFPGTSRHELGEAIDIATADVPALLSVMDQVGICQPLPVTDPIHFVWCG